jgi:CRISPR/Cas system-associated endonuclease Cas1
MIEVFQLLILDTLLLAFLFWGVCFVKLGGRRPLKCKQNSMISLRYSMFRAMFLKDIMIFLFVE